MGQPYVGEIRMFAGNFAPAGWAFCDGSLLPIEENEALFQLIGTTYGGDGETNFALPDLRGRIPLHMGTSSASGTTYNLGQTGGTETVTLTLAQTPSHSHPVAAQTTAGTATSANNAVWALSTVSQYAVTATLAGTMNPAVISSSPGGNQPHDNMMPTLTVPFIISLFGIFPMPS